MRRHFGDLVFDDRRAALGARRRGAEPRPAGHPLRPPLARRRGLLEGGDGACRAQLVSRRGLGRGFEVLIGGSGDTELAHLPIEQVHANPRQPRRRFDHEATAGLADSIRTQGVVQPVVVRPRAEGGYELIAGERRWRAAREAGIPTVPGGDPRGGRPRHAAARPGRERRAREPLGGRGGARLRRADGRVRALARRRLGARRPLEAGDLEQAAAARAAPTTCSRWSSAASSSEGHARAVLAVPGSDRAAQAGAADRRAGPVGARGRACGPLVGRAHEAAHEDRGRPGARGARQGRASGR